jgi:hypothetical protein
MRQFGDGATLAVGDLIAARFRYLFQKQNTRCPGAIALTKMGFEDLMALIVLAIGGTLSPLGLLRQNPVYLAIGLPFVILGCVGLLAPKAVTKRLLRAMRLGHDR